MNRSEDILRETNCLNIQQMQNYINGRLKPSEIRKVELHLASCEFCSEAIEGIADMNDPEKAEMILEQVKKHFNSRLHPHRFPRKKNKNHIGLALIIFIIILLLLLTFYWVDFRVKKEKKEPKMPQQEQPISPK